MHELASQPKRKEGNNGEDNINSEAGPNDPIYTGRWILSPMPAPKKTKKKILKIREKETN